MQKSHRIVLLVIVFFIALALRLWGISNGMPYAQVTDETEDISSSLRIASGGLPHFAYIRTAWNLTEWLAFAPFYVIQKLTHSGYTTDNFTQLYFTQRDQFIVLARLLTAFLTSLMVVPAYFGGRALSKAEFGGVLTALLIAIHPSGVYLAHYALSDNLAVIGVVLAVVGSVFIVQTGSRRAYILGGIGVTLAVLGHMQTYPVVLTVALGHVAYWWKQPGRPRKLLLTRWLWGAGAFAISHVVFNPYIILNPNIVLSDIRGIFLERFTDISSLSQRIAIVRDNLPLPFLMMRPYLAVIAVVGIIIAAYKRSLAALVIAAFGIIFTISVLPAPGPRNTFWLQTLVPVAFLSAYAVISLAKAHQIWLRRMAVVLAAGIIVLALAENVTINRAMTATNTRMVAYEYITTNLPPNARIMIGDPFTYSVPLFRSVQSIQRLQTRGIPAPSYVFQLEHDELFTEPKYDLYGIEYHREVVSDETWWELVRKYDIQYIVEVDHCGGPLRYDDGSHLQYPVVSPPVREKLKLVSVFSPFFSENCEKRIENRTHLENMDLTGWERVGPMIRLYAVPPQVQTNETF
jgi:hypothetical protein